MPNINILRVSSFTKNSIEDGYADSEEGVFMAVAASVGKSFMDKLIANKVKIGVDETYMVGSSTRFDTFFIRFRDTFFDVYVNTELLDLGLDCHSFVLVKDEYKLAIYKSIMAPKRPDTKLALEHGFVNVKKLKN